MKNFFCSRKSFKIYVILIFSSFFYYFYYLFFKDLNPFISGGDDLEHYNYAKINNTLLKSFSLELSDSYIFNGHYLPLINILFIIFGKLFGLKTFGYYIFIYIIHIFNVLLLYFVSKRIGINKFSALFISILFLFFPYNFYTLKWLAAGMNHPLASIFMLGCLLSHIFFIQTKKIKYQVLTIILYILGVLTKGTFYPFFAIIIFYDFFFNSNNPPNIKSLIVTFNHTVRRNWYYILFSVPFYIIHTLKFKTSWTYAAQGGITNNPMLYLARIFDYFKNVFWQFTDYNLILNTIILIIVLLAFLYYIFFSNNKAAKLGLLWVLIIQFSMANIDLRNIDSIPRYSYSLSIGALIFLGSIMDLSKHKKQHLYLILYVFLLINYILKILKISI